MESVLQNKQLFNKISIFDENAYIIVGNFFRKSNGITQENHKSGLTDEAFHAVIKDFVSRNHMLSRTVLGHEGNIVVEGGADIFQKMKRECGDRFSYQHLRGSDAKTFVEGLFSDENDTEVSHSEDAVTEVALLDTCRLDA